MSFHFLSAATECLDWAWVRDPFRSASAVGKDITLKEQETRSWSQTKLC